MYRLCALTKYVLGAVAVLASLAGCPNAATTDELLDLLLGDQTAAREVAAATEDESVQAAPQPGSPMSYGTSVTGSSAGVAATEASEATAGEETAVKDEDVFKALADAVAADDELTAEDSADETHYFGEDATAYDSAETEADAEDVSVTAEVGVTAPEYAVAHGRLRGKYLHDLPDGTSDTTGGVFRGRWLAANGEERGVLRGEYWPFEPGQAPLGLLGGGVFHGKYIDADGEFRGVLRGRYGHGLAGRRLFFGHWIDAGGQLVGVLKGHWRDEPGTGGGRFWGRWAAFNLCDETDSLPPVTFEEGDFGGFTETDEDLGTLGDDGGDVVIEEQADVVVADGPPCIDPNTPHGFLHGWHREWADPNATGGWLYGRWRSADGRLIGYLIGRYELLPPATEETGAQAEGKFYGKYVSLTGHFHGFIRGAYGRTEHKLDVFRGQYFGAAGVLKGELRGRWADLANRPGGPFFGVWYGEE